MILYLYPPSYWIQFGTKINWVNKVAFQIREHYNLQKAAEVVVKIIIHHP